MKKISAKNVISYIYRKVLLPSSFLYAILSMATMMMIDEFDSLKLKKAGLILLFSIAVVLSNLILQIKNVNIVMRSTIHFVCMTASFAGILLYGSGNFKNNASGSMLLLIVFIVMYFIIAPVPIYFMYKKQTKSATDKEEYVKIYMQ